MEHRDELLVNDLYVVCAAMLKSAMVQHVDLEVLKGAMMVVLVVVVK